MIIVMIFSSWCGAKVGANNSEYAYISDADFNLTEDEKKIRILNINCDIVKYDIETIDWVEEVKITPDTYEQKNLDDIVTIDCYVLEDAPEDEVIREDLCGYLDSSNIFEAYEVNIIR